MKSISWFILKCVISGTDIITPDMPPNLDSFASTSPNVLLTLITKLNLQTVFLETLCEDLTVFGC
jgi:hypothetical protein